MYKVYFLLVFIEALDSKLTLNTLRRGITSAMECADVAGFAINNIVFSLHVYDGGSNGY